jgi:hypothetical protein
LAFGRPTGFLLRAGSGRPSGPPAPNQSRFRGSTSTRSRHDKNWTISGHIKPISRRLRPPILKPHAVPGARAPGPRGSTPAAGTSLGWESEPDRTAGRWAPLAPASRRCSRRRSVRVDCAGHGHRPVIAAGRRRVRGAPAWRRRRPARNGGRSIWCTSGSCWSMSPTAVRPRWQQRGWLLVKDADTALHPLACLDDSDPAQRRANRLRGAVRELLMRRGGDLRSAGRSKRGGQPDVDVIMWRLDGPVVRPFSPNGQVAHLHENELPCDGLTIATGVDTRRAARAHLNPFVGCVSWRVTGNGSRRPSTPCTRCCTSGRRSRPRTSGPACGRGECRTSPGEVPLVQD